MKMVQSIVIDACSISGGIHSSHKIGILFLFKRKSTSYSLHYEVVT